MKIQIKKSFRHASSPLPFIVDELVSVPDDLAREWIASGRAVEFAGGQNSITVKPLHPRGDDGPDPAPARRKRETAVRG
jgi:hypothetical protein